MHYTTPVAAIALILPGIATAALPPTDISEILESPPAIIFDFELQPSSGASESPPTIETALILCACAEGNAAAGAVGAGIGAMWGSVVGGAIGSIGGPVGIGIGATIGSGAGGYLGTEIGHAHHRAFGHAAEPPAPASNDGGVNRVLKQLEQIDALTKGD